MRVWLPIPRGWPSTESNLAEDVTRPSIADQARPCLGGHLFYDFSVLAWEGGRQTLSTKSFSVLKVWRRYIKITRLTIGRLFVAPSRFIISWLARKTSIPNMLFNWFSVFCKFSDAALRLLGWICGDYPRAPAESWFAALAIGETFQPPGAKCFHFLEVLATRH